MMVNLNLKKAKQILKNACTITSNTLSLLYSKFYLLFFHKLPKFLRVHHYSNVVNYQTVQIFTWENNDKIDESLMIHQIFLTKCFHQLALATM